MKESNVNQVLFMRLTNCTCNKNPHVLNVNPRNRENRTYGHEILPLPEIGRRRG